MGEEGEEPIVGFPAGAPYAGQAPRSRVEVSAQGNSEQLITFYPVKQFKQTSQNHIIYISSYQSLSPSSYVNICK